MLKMVGSSGQLSLGKKYAGKYFEIEQIEDNALILRPMRVIPESEAWLHEPEMQNKLRQAQAWMKENPPTETDLDALLEQVEDR
ncbi:MAG: hypothetical protein EPN21_01470 [Methylococcaceae bacterium]|nr:MAG: hypothetical protein EPN21_01470 [Methylococcaceae bacterium]